MHFAMRTFEVICLVGLTGDYQYTSHDDTHGLQLPHMTPHYNFLRKPPADFGWDWGPSFTPAGIYGTPLLLATEHAFLKGVMSVLCCAALH